MRCKVGKILNAPASGLLIDHENSVHIQGDFDRELRCGSSKYVNVLNKCGCVIPRRAIYLCNVKSIGRCKKCRDRDTADMDIAFNAGYARCACCGETREVEFFAKCKTRGRNGIQRQCRNCKNKHAPKGSVQKEFESHFRELVSSINANISRVRQHQHGYKKHKKSLMESTGFKTCCNCKETKATSDYYRRGKSPSGLVLKSVECKLCVSKQYRKKVGRPVSSVVLATGHKDKRSWKRLGFESQTAASSLMAGMDTKATLESWMKDDNKWGAGGNYDLDKTWQVDHIYPVSSYVMAVELGCCTKEEAYIHCEHHTNKKAMTSRENMSKSNHYDGERKGEPFPDPRYRTRRRER
jgi:hypothetical protein